MPIARQVAPTAAKHALIACVYPLTYVGGRRSPVVLEHYSIISRCDLAKRLLSIPGYTFSLKSPTSSIS